MTILWGNIAIWVVLQCYVGFGDFLGMDRQTAPSDYVILFSVWTDQGGQGHCFVALANA